MEPRGGFPGVVAEKPEVRVVTAAATLNPNDTIVEAVLPALSANTYEITLPPVARCIDRKYTIYAKVPAVYTDGQVTVDDQEDSIVSFSSTDGLSAAGDILVITNHGGKMWEVTYDKTT